MIPTNKISGALRDPLPALTIGCQISVNDAYKRSVLDHQDAIKAIGGCVKKVGDDLDINFNWEEGSPSFDKKSFQLFMHRLEDILPHDAFECMYLTFSEELDPTPSLIDSFENHRRRNGQTPDYSIRNADISLSASTNGESVRQLTRTLPNELEIAYRYERNRNPKKAGKLYDLIGECFWDRELTESGAPITDVQISQMVRAICSLRDHALASMKPAAPTQGLN